MSNRASLVDTCVLITRPAVVADGLRRGVEALGGVPVCVPTVRIEALPELAGNASVFTRLEREALIIFVSSNAVRFAMPLIQAAGLLTRKPDAIAVGPATAATLLEFELEAVMTPETRFDTEGLLAMPVLSAQQVDARQVIICKGTGGRFNLELELRRRGAKVTMVDVYRRVPGGIEERRRLYEVREKVDVAVVTSGEGLRNLFALLDVSHHDWLQELPLVVPSRRVADVGIELGLRCPALVAGGAGDAAVLASLVSWRCQQLRCAGEGALS